MIRLVEVPDLQPDGISNILQINQAFIFNKVLYDLLGACPSIIFTSQLIAAIGVRNRFIKGVGTPYQDA